MFAAIAAISVVGPVLFLSQSPHGVHASPDSFTYLGAAENLAEGKGWTYPFGETGTPVTLFPPIYPLLLAVPALLEVSPFDWVLWQNAFLMGILSFLVGVTVLAATASWVTAGSAILLVQLGTPTTTAYAHIWSEPLFYPIVVVILVSLSRYLTTGRTSWLVVAAASTSIGMLTRYAGLSIFAAALLLLVGWPGRSARGRLRSVTVFAGIALSLSGLWMIRNHATSGTLTGDNQLIHGLSGQEVIEGFRTVGSWFVPLQPGDGTSPFFWLFLASVVLVSSLVMPALIRTDRKIPIEHGAIVAVCLVYAVVHFGFIALANAYSTRSPPFNDRILGSTFAPIVIAVVVLGRATWEAFRHRRLVPVSLLVAIGSLLALSIVGATHTMPLRYSSARGTLPYYRDLSRSLAGVIMVDHTLLSNRANIAWFVTGRPVASLPRSCRGGQVLPNPSYDDELRALAGSLSEDPRQVIFFRRSPKCEPFSLKGLKETLRVEHVGAKGAVFVLDGPSRGG